MNFYHLILIKLINNLMKLFNYFLIFLITKSFHKHKFLYDNIKKFFNKIYNFLQPNLQLFHRNSQNSYSILLA